MAYHDPDPPGIVYQGRQLPTAYNVVPGITYRVCKLSVNVYNNKLYVWPVLEEEFRDLILNELNRTLHGLRKLVVPKVGLRCCCLHRGRWSRVMVKHVTDDNSVLVTFLDYGQSTYLSYASFSETPPSFATLAPLAILVTLKDPSSVFEFLEFKEIFLQFRNWNPNTCSWSAVFKGIPQGVMRVINDPLSEEEKFFTKFFDFPKFMQYLPTNERSYSSIDIKFHFKIESESAKVNSTQPSDDEMHNWTPRDILRFFPEDVLEECLVKWTSYHVAPNRVAVYIHFHLEAFVPYDISAYLLSMSERDCAYFVKMAIIPSVNLMLKQVFPEEGQESSYIFFNYQQPIGGVGLSSMYGCVWNHTPITLPASIADEVSNRRFVRNGQNSCITFDIKDGLKLSSFARYLSLVVPHGRAFGPDIQKIEVASSDSITSLPVRHSVYGQHRNEVSTYGNLRTHPLPANAPHAMREQHEHEVVTHGNLASQTLSVDASHAMYEHHMNEVYPHSNLASHTPSGNEVVSYGNLASQTPFVDASHAIYEQHMNDVYPSNLATRPLSDDTSHAMYEQHMNEVEYYGNLETQTPFGNAANAIYGQRMNEFLSYGNMATQNPAGYASHGIYGQHMNEVVPYGNFTTHYASDNVPNAIYKHDDNVIRNDDVTYGYLVSLPFSDNSSNAMNEQHDNVAIQSSAAAPTFPLLRNPPVVRPAVMVIPRNSKWSAYSSNPTPLLFFSGPSSPSSESLIPNNPYPIQYTIQDTIPGEPKAELVHENSSYSVLQSYNYQSQPFMTRNNTSNGICNPNYGHIGNPPSLSAPFYPSIESNTCHPNSPAVAMMMPEQHYMPPTAEANNDQRQPWTDFPRNEPIDNPMPDQLVNNFDSSESFSPHNSGQMAMLREDYPRPKNLIRPIMLSCITEPSLTPIHSILASLEMEMIND